MPKIRLRCLWISPECNLFDQDAGKARCTHIPLVLIFLGEMQLSVVKSSICFKPFGFLLVLNIFLTYICFQFPSKNTKTSQRFQMKKNISFLKTIEKKTTLLQH